MHRCVQTQRQAEGSFLFLQPATIPTMINFNNPTGSTQPTYNSQTWQSTLISQGYTSSEISTATRYLNTLKVKPGANLATIAANYINHSKQTGATAVIGATLAFADAVTTSTSNISGPNFNPVYAGGTAGFNEGLGPVI